MFIPTPQSLTYLVYKNEIYKQNHPVIWVGGQAIELYKKIPKLDQSNIVSINDLGEFLIKSTDYTYFVEKNGNYRTVHPVFEKLNNSGSLFSKNWITNVPNEDTTHT